MTPDLYKIFMWRCISLYLSSYATNYICSMFARLFSIGQVTRLKQYGLVLAVIGVVVSVGFIFSDSISYRMVAFGLLLAVTLMALFFDIRLIFVAALLSALLWGYLFIPPRFDFTIVLPQTGCCSLPILWWHSTTSILS
ncbi:MAG: hypothetical protein OJF59_000347 [Cytophagales bacterium]|nr:MAG: hypothetical protein OJF59_000347 [Cytophagales bacterium]